MGISDANVYGSDFFSILFFKLWKYDNTFAGDLENTGKGYI